jgi:hypothetical protein
VRRSIVFRKSEVRDAAGACLDDIRAALQAQDEADFQRRARAAYEVRLKG